MLKKWSIDDLKCAVKYSTSILEVAQKLQASSRTVKRYIDLLKIDTPHFPTQKERLAKSLEKSKLIPSDIFTQNSKVAQHILKQEFLRTCKYECTSCFLAEWMGKPIILQLDHINGNSHDNRIDNLRLLCPNCHSQTETYCGKNIKKATKNVCANCNCKVYKTSTLCRKCSNTKKGRFLNKGNFKIEWPDDQTLHNMIKTSNILQVAKKLGVSYNAVKKRIAARNITLK